MHFLPLSLTVERGGITLNLKRFNGFSIIFFVIMKKSGLSFKESAVSGRPTSVFASTYKKPPQTPPNRNQMRISGFNQIVGQQAIDPNDQRLYSIADPKRVLILDKDNKNLEIPDSGLNQSTILIIFRFDLP